MAYSRFTNYNKPFVLLISHKKLHWVHGKTNTRKDIYMRVEEMKCKTCGKKGTLYVEDNKLYCEEHCKYLNNK